MNGLVCGDVELWGTWGREGKQKSHICQVENNAFNQLTDCFLVEKHDEKS